jgi:hypothetical protein
MSAKTIVLAFGVVILLVGILGFFMDPVLGIFAANTLLNLIHTVSGLLAMFLGMRSEWGAKLFAKVFGVVYALLAVLGLVLSGDKILGVLTVNLAGDILHAVLALVFLFAGFSQAKSTPDAPAGAANPPGAQ